jgi:hypothetical protein
MELEALYQFIISWKALTIALIMTVLFATAYWLYSELSGRNYYKKYPIAKAIDDLAVSGELKGKDITKAISDIDLDATPQFQAGQFTQKIKKQ